MDLLKHEPALRLGAFFFILLTMGIWELVAPRRKLTQSKGKRWSSNLLLIVVDTFFIRFAVPTTAILFAGWAETRGAGLLRQTDLSPALATLVAIIALDFIIYVQHVAFHAIPSLWRLHLVHHADRDIDVTTGLRFHPIEILISMGIKFASIYWIGASPLAVLLFEVILNGSAMFNHSNAKLPLGLDSVLRFFIVTPDMHRVHHSIHPRETNSNFGFNLSLWDRIMGTYRAQPKDGHEGMTIGLSQLQDARPNRLLWMLKAPFGDPRGEYSFDGELSASPEPMKPRSPALDPQA